MPLHLGTRVSSLAYTSCCTHSKRCKDDDSWREKASGLEAKELKSVCGRHGDGRDVSHHPEWELSLWFTSQVPYAPALVELTFRYQEKWQGQLCRA